jgi:hypothetical protein
LLGAALTVGVAAVPGVAADARDDRTPDAELLLQLDLLKEADLAAQRGLLGRPGLLDQLRLLETLGLLESQTPVTPARRPADGGHRKP